MGFDGLLGNARIKENLRRSFEAGRISHFYLISGPQGSGKKTLAKRIAAAAVCTDRAKPCLRCSACRKAMADTHPDIITVTDPEHKNVAVKIVREYRADVYIQPNEADKKVYIFPQEMGIEGQNALLKVLEEPPAYGVFLLLTDNPQKILPTVRSRCTLLQMESLPRDLLRSQLQSRFPQSNAEDIHGTIERSGGYLGQAIALLEEGQHTGRSQDFVKAYLSRDAVALVQLLVPMEKMKRDQVIPELTQWLQLVQNALSCRGGLPATSSLVKELSQSDPVRLMATMQDLQKALEYINANVSVAAVCGHLQWSLR